MNTLVTTARFSDSGYPYTEEHKNMQEWARNSWALLEMRVIIYNKVGNVYNKDLTRELMNYDVAALINADIILTSNINRVFDKIRSIDGPAYATSHRYNFRMKEYPNLMNAKIFPPYGLDVFVGNNAFWSEWYKIVPDKLSVLGPTGDNAICSFGNGICGENAYDFTDLRCLYHPIHKGRIPDRDILNCGLNMDTARCGIPENKIL